MSVAPIPTSSPAENPSCNDGVVGVGLEDGEGVGVMVGLELAVGLGVGPAVGSGVGFRVGLGADVGAVVGVAVGRGAGAWVGAAAGGLAAALPPPAAGVSGLQATSARVAAIRAPAIRPAPNACSARPRVTPVMSGLRLSVCNRRDCCAGLARTA